MKKVKATSRNTRGLCEALFEEFDLLRAGKSDHHRASAVAKLAIQIIATKRLEIDAAAFTDGAVKLRPLALVGNGLQLGAAQ